MNPERAYPGPLGSETRLSRTSTLANPPLLEPEDALILDVDGPIWESLFSSRSCGALLKTLLRHAATSLSGAAAVISGKPLAELVQALGAFSGSVAGTYGLERHTATGAVIRSAPDPAIEPARRLLASFAAATPGVVLEDGKLAIALNFEAAPQSRQACAAVMAEAAQMSDGRLVVRYHAANLELHPRNATKGVFIPEILREPSFWGRRPVLVGDSRLCPDAFAAVRRFDGVTVAIGSGAHGGADFRLVDCGQLATWLAKSFDLDPVLAPGRPLAGFMER
ncbi:MAG TPA: trehalose-phosphatase [Alphaproteobacteria bacterium]|nr:trehalose-phosphatase [Alphaproteobacteria bacterium]